jgi:hypothetical protein
MNNLRTITNLHERHEFITTDHKHLKFIEVSLVKFTINLNKGTVAECYFSSKTEIFSANVSRQNSGNRHSATHP